MVNDGDYYAGIPVQEEDEEEDGEEEEGEEEDEEMKEFRESDRRKEEFFYECLRKWKEQGKTEEECKMMCLASSPCRLESREWDCCTL